MCRNRALDGPSSGLGQQWRGHTSTAGRGIMFFGPTPVADAGHVGIGHVRYPTAGSASAQVRWSGLSTYSWKPLLTAAVALPWKASFGAGGGLHCLALRPHIAAADVVLASWPSRREQEAQPFFVNSPLGIYLIHSTCSSPLRPSDTLVACARAYPLAHRRRRSPFLSTPPWASTSSTMATSPTPSSCASCSTPPPPSSTATCAPTPTPR